MPQWASDKIMHIPKIWCGMCGSEKNVQLFEENCQYFFACDDCIKEYGIEDIIDTEREMREQHLLELKAQYA